MRPISEVRVPAVRAVISELIDRADLRQGMPNLHEAASRIQQVSRYIGRRSNVQFTSCKRSQIEIQRRRHEEPLRIGVLWFSIRVWTGGHWQIMQVIGTLEDARKIQ